MSVMEHATVRSTMPRRSNTTVGVGRRNCHGTERLPAPVYRKVTLDNCREDPEHLSKNSHSDLSAIDKKNQISTEVINPGHLEKNYSEKEETIL